MTPLFSVIIPTYNRVSLIEETLRSVFRQKFKDYEVIVVDDDSNDRTENVLESYLGRIRLLKQTTNKGSGAARNLGISQAQGLYIAFLDSDDIWFSWTLDVFARLINEHEAPSILSARLLEFSQFSELTSVREESVTAEVFSDYFAASEVGHFVGAGMSVLKQEEVLKSGGFTEQRINLEDHDLILRLGTAPGFVQILAPITLGWRRHPHSATADAKCSVEGNRFLLEQERDGVYPGGSSRAKDRRQIIARHVRPTIVACLRMKLRNEAWGLYWDTFRWHLRLRRWKFLFGFPIRALLTR